MARGLTVAVYVFSINVLFTIFQAINPFSTSFELGLSNGLIDTAMSAANVSSVSFLGIPEIVMAINLFLNLVLGPFILVPQILNLIGVTGIINTMLTACSWMIWGWFIFQIISGRMLTQVK